MVANVQGAGGSGQIPRESLTAITLAQASATFGKSQTPANLTALAGALASVKQTSATSQPPVINLTELPPVPTGLNPTETKLCTDLRDAVAAHNTTPTWTTWGNMTTAFSNLESYATFSGNATGNEWLSMSNFVVDLGYASL